MWCVLPIRTHLQATAHEALVGVLALNTLLCVRWVCIQGFTIIFQLPIQAT